MNSTSLVAKQYRLQEWTQQVQKCRSRSKHMKVDEWCEINGVTKANYYYQLRQARKARLDAMPKILFHCHIYPEISCQRLLDRDLNQSTLTQ